MRQTITAGTTTSRHTRVADARSVRLSAVEIAALVLVVLALVAAAIGPAVLREAPAPSDTTAIKVSDHDTLWEIAAAHPLGNLTTAETVQVILDLNDLPDSTIVAGQLLVVPSGTAAGPVLASN